MIFSLAFRASVFFKGASCETQNVEKSAQKQPSSGMKMASLRSPASSLSHPSRSLLFCHVAHTWRRVGGQRGRENGIRKKWGRKGRKEERKKRKARDWCQRGGCAGLISSVCSTYPRTCVCCMNVFIELPRRLSDRHVNQKVDGDDLDVKCSKTRIWSNCCHWFEPVFDSVRVARWQKSHSFLLVSHWEARLPRFQTRDLWNLWKKIQKSYPKIGMHVLLKENTNYNIYLIKIQLTSSSY